MATLLGHLAQFASFLSQGEVLCTQGLTYLLQKHPDARSAFAGELSVRAGVSINHDLTWHAEQRQSDGARPDLEAVLADNTPIVKSEAKLDAASSIPGSCDRTSRTSRSGFRAGASMASSSC